jgi:hypothetical protein
VTEHLSVTEEYSDDAAHETAKVRFFAMIREKEEGGWTFRKGSLKYHPAGGKRYTIECDMDRDDRP